MDMNKKYGKISLILLVVLATVLVSGCIGGGTDETKFTKTVNVEGVTFYLPETFSNEEKTSTGKNIQYSFSDGSSTIMIFNYPGASKELILSQLKDTGEVSDIREDVTYAGVSGHTMITAQTNLFLFEKNGKTFIIEMSSDINFEEYIPKILGN